MDLPFKAEYAKSGRSSCRSCKSAISNGVLRLAIMVQSPMYDGKVPQWYHYKCFFDKSRVKTTDDIENFESLRIEDQNKIRENIKNVASIVVPDKKGKGKKRDAAAMAAKKAALKDFTIEYAKSGRATCRGCEQKILKDEIRISKKDFDTEIGRKYGGQDMWHHLTCFAKLRSELGYFESGDQLPHFNLLKTDDQNEVKKQLPPIKQEDVPEIKKVKGEDTTDGFTKEESKLYSEQVKIMYKHRDALKKNLNKNELIELLEANDQEVPSGVDRILDRLADIMTFGAFLPCEVCKSGQFVFDKFGYRCSGDLTEWSKCNTIVKEPKRKAFIIPKELAKEYHFLKKYKYVMRTRVVKAGSYPQEVKKEEEEDTQPKVIREAPPLLNMEFVILGNPERGKDKLKTQIMKLGGKVTTKIDGEHVMAVIASSADVEKMNARMQTVQENRIHVVSENFVDDVPKFSGKIPELIMNKSICDWGVDPTTRLPPPPSSSKSKSKKSIYTSSKPSKIKLTLKGGAAVDPDSGLEQIAHVYTDGKQKYSAVLGKTDIQSKKNSFYKLQLLQADNKKKFWVFRAWGRIGTTIGSNKLERYDSLLLAKQAFTALYEEKTGNMWENQGDFHKIPGLFYPIDIDYGDDIEEKQSMEIVESTSKLPQPVQNLMRLIFDVNAMKNLMLEFELDTEKMPLGKLSKKQIQSAYGVLKELQVLLDENGPNARFIDASNRFYTFIPHSFGIDDPPTLKNAELIKQKIDMLDNLMELEIAYSLMKSSGSEHTVDSYYKQLNTDIEVLNKDSDEFKIIDEYVKNTHAATHSSYTLDIQDIFTIRRQGEEKRFKPFRKLHNHKLLWHGSRTTNFAGILAQGLRIAPPEAPVTGYMFGKGIYFADMVSKSANYCCTSPANPTGLLLLCDVALGNMYERNRAEYVEKLPKGKHSTKGLGQTEPNPKEVKLLDGVEVPLGKGMVNPKISSELLYNEYIVYDVAQVNVKYLLKVNFKYNY